MVSKAETWLMIDSCAENIERGRFGVTRIGEDVESAFVNEK